MKYSFPCLLCIILVATSSYHPPVYLNGDVNVLAKAVNFYAL